MMITVFWRGKCWAHLSDLLYIYTGVPGGKVSILGGHSVGHSKKKSLYEYVSYSERFPIFGAQYFPSLPLYEQSQQLTDASHRFRHWRITVGAKENTAHQIQNTAL
jgi:hypothetical protein